MNMTANMLELDQAMNLKAVQPDPQEQRGAMKFLFPSGSKPLADYTIKRGVGRGGFGEVYYAVSDGGKEVALKLIRRNLDVELRGVTNCLNLKHPNLLSLFDVRHDDQDNTWVVMEYVAGESLDEVIARNPHGMSSDEVVEWMHGILAGVAYLHDHGIVHRDLKPGNIFNDDGVIKLGDYGLAKFISCSRRSGQTESIGTVHYMAPEVANGRYGREIDIYALGIILYELLTGHVPFDGESIGEVLMKHLTAEPDLTIVAEPFRTIVARALAKDPTVRFASVQELRAALPPLQTGASRLASAGFVRAAGASPRRAHTTPPRSPDFVAAGATQTFNRSFWGMDDEPIARAVRDAWRRLTGTWYNANLPAKIAILIGCMYLVFRFGFSLEPIAIRVAIAYGVYLLIRAIVRDKERKSHLSSQPARDPARNASHAATNERSRDPASPAAAAFADAKANPQAWRRKNWRDRQRPTFVIKPPRERVAELLGSLLLSTGVAAIISLVMLLLHGADAESSQNASQYAWLTMVSIAGSWLVLVATKFWEGRSGDVALRRFVMLVIGMLVGAAAYAVQVAFQVPLAYELDLMDSPFATQTFFDQYGRPGLFAYLAYFGCLFLLLRLWRQTDPLRSTRLSLWHLAVCVGVAWMVAQIWHCPQPWGLMIVAIVSISIQLASPWQSPRIAVQQE